MILQKILIICWNDERFKFSIVTSTKRDVNGRALQQNAPKYFRRSCLSRPVSPEIFTIRVWNAEGRFLNCQTSKLKIKTKIDIKKHG